MMGVHGVSLHRRAAQRRHKMSDSEPSQWQIALAVMENIREVQRRADSDSLRYIGLVAAFLVIRGQGRPPSLFLGYILTIRNSSNLPSFRSRHSLQSDTRGLKSLRHRFPSF
jgi:hypothetical protein